MSDELAFAFTVANIVLLNRRASPRTNNKYLPHIYSHRAFIIIRQCSCERTFFIQLKDPLTWWREWKLPTPPGCRTLLYSRSTNSQNNFGWVTHNVQKWDHCKFWPKDFCPNR